MFPRLFQRLSAIGYLPSATRTCYPLSPICLIALAACSTANPSVVATSVAATVAALPTTTPIVAIVEVTPVPQSPATGQPQGTAPTMTVTATAQPSATPTASPSPTITDTPSPNNPKAGLRAPNIHEDFANGEAWVPYEDDFSKMVIGEGRLDFTIKPINRFAWTLTGLQAGNFYAEVNARVERCATVDQYGLVFRKQDFTDADGYYFTLSCDGRYKLNKRKFDEFTPLIDWAVPTTGDAIHAGPNAANLLGVRAEGGHFRLYANDQLLAEFDDADFAAGRFGLFAGSAATQNFLATFDDLQIWNLP